jgi:hypothetical protein
MEENAELVSLLEYDSTEDFSDTDRQVCFFQIEKKMM